MISKQSGYVSFVIPAKDEEKTIAPLYDGIAQEMARLPWDFEVIFIDDGSEDSTWIEMEKLAQKHEHVRALQFRRNAGKARALAVGFECSKGDLVFTMDADLQDDPKEIPKFIDRLAEGYDVLSGYKKKRHDPWHKVWPSRIFNRMLNRVAGTNLHDHNCGFKCYRREVIEQLNPYGEMHRMLASLSSFEGYHVGEVVVDHRPREFGHSKYGFKRFVRGFMDMVTVGFLGHYGERPMHLSGITAILLGLVGSIMTLLGAAGFITQPGLASLLIVLGVMTGLFALPLLGLGLLAELIISGRLAYNRRPPVIRDTQAYFRRNEPQVDAKAPEDEKDKAPEALRYDSLSWHELLVVDDSDFVREFVKEVLFDSGLRLVEAPDGIAALDRVNEHTAVIILDLNMPRMSGAEFLEHIKANYPDVSVIVVSGISDVPNVVNILKKGAYDYLTKPIQPANLRDAVDKALNHFKAIKGWVGVK